MGSRKNSLEAIRMAIVSSIMQAGSSMTRIKHQNLKKVSIITQHQFLYYSSNAKFKKDHQSSYEETYIRSCFKKLLHAIYLSMHCSQHKRRLNQFQTEEINPQKRRRREEKTKNQNRSESIPDQKQKRKNESSMSKQTLIKNKISPVSAHSRHPD